MKPAMSRQYYVQGLLACSGEAPGAIKYNLCHKSCGSKIDLASAVPSFQPQSHKTLRSHYGIGSTFNTPIHRATRK